MKAKRRRTKAQEGPIDVPCLQYKSKKRQLTSAYHEAGHVVASWLTEGLDAIGAVSIIPQVFSDGTGNKGHTCSRKPREMKSRLDREKVIISLLAGGIAEHKFNPLCPPSSSDDDYGKAIYLASDDCCTRREMKAYLRWLSARAEDTVKYHWLAIQELAEELSKRQKMSGAALRKWLNEWDPSIVRPDGYVERRDRKLHEAEQRERFLVLCQQSRAGGIIAPHKKRVSGIAAKLFDAMQGVK